MYLDVIQDGQRDRATLSPTNDGPLQNFYLKPDGSLINENLGRIARSTYQAADPNLYKTIFFPRDNQIPQNPEDSFYVPIKCSIDAVTDVFSAVLTEETPSSCVSVWATVGGCSLGSKSQRTVLVYRSH